MVSRENVKTQVTSNASNETPRLDEVIFLEDCARLELGRRNKYDSLTSITLQRPPNPLVGFNY